MSEDCEMEMGRGEKERKKRGRLKEEDINENPKKQTIKHKQIPKHNKENAFWFCTRLTTLWSNKYFKKLHVVPMELIFNLHLLSGSYDPVNKISCLWQFF